MSVHFGPSIISICSWWTRNKASWHLVDLMLGQNFQASHHSRRFFFQMSYSCYNGLLNEMQFISGVLSASYSSEPQENVASLHCKAFNLSQSEDITKKSKRSYQG